MGYIFCYSKNSLLTHFQYSRKLTIRFPPSPSPISGTATQCNSPASRSPRWRPTRSRRWGAWWRRCCTTWLLPRHWLPPRCRLHQKEWLLVGSGGNSVVCSWNSENDFAVLLNVFSWGSRSYQSVECNCALFVETSVVFVVENAKHP